MMRRKSPRTSGVRREYSTMPDPASSTENHRVLDHGPRAWPCRKHIVQGDLGVQVEHYVQIRQAQIRIEN